MILMIYNSNSKKECIINIIKNLQRTDKFSCDYFITGADDLSTIAVDTKKQNVAFLLPIPLDDSQFGEYFCKLILVDYSKILSVELFENTQSIYSTSRGGQVVGALVGGALLGGVGAVIGGLSSNKIKNQKVSRVELHIVLDDISCPLIKFPLLGDGDSFGNPEYETSSIFYIDAMKEADLWLSRLKVMMKAPKKKKKVIIRYIEDNI